MKEKHLGLKDAIHEANKSMSGAYFPFTGITPLIATMDKRLGNRGRDE